MAPRYRKISVQIWNDEKVRGMSIEGKCAFLFVLTHPSMTGIGAMRGTIEGLAAELKASPEGFREPFGIGLLKADEDACLIVVPNFLRHNIPDNPNVVKSWKWIDELLPECALKYQHYQAVKAFIESLGEPYAKGLPIPFGKGYANTQSTEHRALSIPQEDICAEPETGSAPKQVRLETPFLSYPCTGPEREWVLTEEQVAEWARVYDTLDIRVVCKQALAWLQANPGRRKTARGMPRFLQAWLQRQANSPRNGSVAKTTRPDEARPGEGVGSFQL